MEPARYGPAAVDPAHFPYNRFQRNNESRESNCVNHYDYR